MTSGWATSPDAIQREATFSGRADDVVEIEKHGVMHQFVVGDFRERQCLDRDRPVGLVGITEPVAT